MMDRREFTTQAVLALLAGVTITITGCGTDHQVAPTPVAPPPTDKSGVIANNHGHSVVVTSAQQTAGAAIAVDIRGEASHSHMVELTQAEVLTIRSGLQVVKESTGTGHKHMVTFN